MEDEVPKVERQLEALYGTRALLVRGVVHVTAVMRSGRELRVIRIGDDAPKSATDFFVLNLCRARADAILTTAANLRAEPTLHHGLQGSWAAALSEYRRVALAKERPPCCAILTRSGSLPLAHPAWSDGTPKLVLTAEQPSASVLEALRSRAELECSSAMDARHACELLRRRGHGLVSVEAGPTAVRTLYAADSAVDELLLTLYEGPRTDVPLAGALPADDELFRARTCVADTAVDEPSGRFRFQRWLRA